MQIWGPCTSQMRMPYQGSNSVKHKHEPNKYKSWRNMLFIISCNLWCLELYWAIPVDFLQARKTFLQICKIETCKETVTCNLQPQHRHIKPVLNTLVQILTWEHFSLSRQMTLQQVNLTLWPWKISLFDHTVIKIRSSELTLFWKEKLLSCGDLYPMFECFLFPPHQLSCFQNSKRVDNYYLKGRTVHLLTQIQKSDFSNWAIIYESLIQI